jgi:dipeptidyl aminopeptidase/acylaminoacyl peptidase
MIAFSRFREVRRGGELQARSRGIYLMRADGSAKHRLIGCRCGVPAWGPGGRLVFEQETRPSRIVLFRQGRIRVLARGQSPAWSPDGRWIAFTRNDRPQPEGFSLSSIYVMRPDGSRIRRLAPGADPNWTPNGQRIVFRGERPFNLILSLRPDGSGLRRIAVFRSPDPQNSTPLQPTNAPDGRLIAFSKRFADDPDWIWLMRADGSERRRIFNPNRWATSGGLPERFIGFSSVFPTGLDWRPLPRPQPTP